jgi:phage tail-like protein
LNTNPESLDPYGNFKFRIKWDGKYVAGVSKLSPLKRHTQVIEHQDGAEPKVTRKTPGRTTFDAITLERGITQDMEFENWANKILSYSNSPSEQTDDFRKDLSIEMYNEEGQLELVYKVYRCWVSEYVSSPDYDPSAIAVAVEYIKLENEGWERQIAKKK